MSGALTRNAVSPSRRGPFAGPARRFVIRALTVVGLLVVGCGESADAPDDVCADDGPIDLRLGTGVAAFEPLLDGQDLVLARGIQGGCHLWLAADVTGFRPEVVEAQYEVFEGPQRLATGVSRARVRDLGAGCGFVGWPAILEAPWLLEDRSVRVRLTITQDDGLRTADDEATVVVRWPADVPGEDPDLACGPRS